VLICLGCSAQSVPSDLVQKIEHEVRAYYSIPPSVMISVSPLRASDFPGYDALTITMEGNDKRQTYEFLLSKDRNTLLRVTKLDLSKDPYAEVMKKIDVTGRPLRGNKEAKVVVVNYDDFQCPFCARMHQTLFPELLKEYGDRVAFVYKDFPLTDIHPWATHAAVDANCLAAQSNDAYWDFADQIHGNPRQISGENGPNGQFAMLDRVTTEQGQKHNLDLTKLESCIKAQNTSDIKASTKEGESVGVSATPTIFINGQELDGALPVAEIRAVLDQALQRAGVPVPAHPAAPASSAPSGGSSQGSAQ
jgi:protein-disulfide isomerase